MFISIIDVCGQSLFSHIVMLYSGFLRIRMSFVYRQFSHTFGPMCLFQQLNHCRSQFGRINIEFDVKLLFILRIHDLHANSKLMKQSPLLWHRPSEVIPSKGCGVWEASLACVHRHMPRLNRITHCKMLANSHKQLNDHLKHLYKSSFLTCVLKQHVSYQEQDVTPHLLRLLQFARGHCNYFY